ncbi:MAG: hypothetical protein IKB71_12000 [Lentisphaeria bacterium]|nr:hypothetical protein [Lentisphaeria bacterium]
MTELKFEDGKIYSLASGDLVAVVDENGELKIQPGKNAMTRKIREFFSTLDAGIKENIPENIPGNMPEKIEEVNTHILQENDKDTFSPDPEQTKNAEVPLADFAVEDIPESQLPHFDFALGVETPEFKAFVRKHKLNKSQIIQLIKRLEK